MGAKQSAMATASPAKLLQNELSCSLCHEYFMEPMSIPCGHSFCQVCIINFWGEQETDVSCPQCGEISATRELRPNKELGVVAAIAKQVNFETVERAGGEKMCEVHQESLKLFCKDEGKLMCPSCAGSEEHAGHILASAEDAAEDYKQKLQIHLQALMEERKKALDFQTKEYGNKYFLEDVEAEKQKIMSKFEELERFLKKQKEAMLDQLDELVKKQEKFATRLSSEICVFDTLIRDVEEKCKQPANVFLQDVGETLSRCKIWEFQQPPDISSELNEKLCAISKNYLIMQATVKEFKETFPQDAAVKWVKVTLDPDTAHYDLKVSANQKTLRQERGDFNCSPQRFKQASCVLGCEGFTSGRHYWEVKIGEEAYWAVGVARESVKRQEKLELNPEEGVWVMKKESAGGLTLWEGGPTLHSDIPKTVGVFLDYGLNRVVFFDADQGTALYTFHSASFQHKKIRPFFWLKEPRNCKAQEHCYIQLCA